MSLMDGLSGLGQGLSDYAGKALSDMALEESKPLMSRAAVEKAAPAQEASAPATAEPPSAGHKPGEAVDDATLGRAHQVYLGLVERGMDPSTAIGFAANAVQESAANPQTGAGDAGASHGLLQWRGDRLTRYVDKFGHTPEQGDLNEQLDYVMHELSGPESGAWKAIQAAPHDPFSRAAAVSQYFERPKDTTAEIARRGWIADQLTRGFARTGSV